MKYFAIVGKKYQELAKAEIAALFQIYGKCSVKNIDDTNVIVAEGSCSNIYSVASRAVYTKYIAQEIDIDEQCSFLSGKTFSCIGKDPRLIHIVAEKLKKSNGAKVSLKNPHFQILVINPEHEISHNTIGKKNKINMTDITGSDICHETNCRNNKYSVIEVGKKNTEEIVLNKYLVGVRIPQPKLDWEQKRATKRAFFHPSALEARLCRVLINLAQLKEGDIMLDPFCGTGGIMIEAEILGIRAVGFDIMSNMCKGATKNGLNNIVQCNSQRPPVRNNCINAIVTDIPYGRSTSVEPLDRKEMLKSIVSNAPSIARTTILMCTTQDEQVMQFEGNEVKNIYRIYQHKNLTRSIVMI